MKNREEMDEKKWRAEGPERHGKERRQTERVGRDKTGRTRFDALASGIEDGVKKV